jgi:hypothetical protein
MDESTARVIALEAEVHALRAELKRRDDADAFGADVPARGLTKAKSEDGKAGWLRW